MRRTRGIRAATFPAAILLAALALAGCAAAPNMASSTDQSGGGVSAPAPGAVGEGTTQSGDSLKDTAGSPLTAFPADREVITTGYVTITVDKPTDAATEAIRITEQAGGRIDGRSETAPTDGTAGSATLTLRIPSTALDATLDALRGLGTVNEVSLNSSDVTMQTQDLDARITALQASVDRLLGLLATASDTEALVQLETALSDRQGELESLQSQRRYLGDQISLSTVTLNLVSQYTGPVAGPSDFFSGLLAGWNAFLGFLGWLIVAVGVALPWLAFAGLVLLIVILLVRRRRRARARRAATTPPAPE